MKAPAPPHVARLLRRVETLDAPAVQLWAWPGSGQQAVLDALVAAGREVAQPLSLDDLGDPQRLRQVVEVAADAGARWLVLPAVPAPPRHAASALATLLPAGRRLLFSAWERRRADPVVTAWIDPRDHLLTGDEVAALWSTATGREPGGALVDSLLAATDGWYRPLALLAERAARGRSLADRSLVDLRGMRSFLRHEVLGRMADEELQLLADLAIAERIDRDDWRRRLDGEGWQRFDRLHRELGLLLPAGDDEERGDQAVLRLPALLRRHLLVEAAEASWSGERRRWEQLRRELAVAERRRGDPGAALTVLIEGGDGEDLTTELLVDCWAELLVSVPAQRLAEALPAAPVEGEPVPIALLCALVGGRRAATRSDGWAPDLAALESLAAAADETPGPETPGVAAVSAAARCVLALLGRCDAADPVEPADPPGALPSPLVPLARLARAIEAAARREAAEELERAAEAIDGAAGGVAAALTRVPPPEAALKLDFLAAGAAPPAGEPVATRLAAAAIERLDRAAPEVVRALPASPQLAPGWRRWLLAPGGWRGGSYGAERAGRRGFRLVLLGGGRAERFEADGGSCELSWPLKRAFKALAFLATQPGMAAERTSLERALWPREEVDTGDGLVGWQGGSTTGQEVERNFHPTLSHLRRGLLEGLGSAEEWPLPLLHVGGVYRLNPVLDWVVDAAELERLLDEGRAALDLERVELAVTLLERACRLYSAPFLAGYDEPWIVDRRERYQRAHLDLLSTLGETYLHLGRLGEAMDSLRTVLIADPLQERVHRALMHVYGRQGRRDLVRRQFDRLTEMLTRELSVEPQQETTELYHRLMA